MKTNDEKSFIEKKIKNPDGFVYNIASKYEPMIRQCPTLDREDLVQMAWEKLLVAQESWNKKREAKFTTFAYVIIRNYVLDKIRFWNNRTKHEVSYSKDDRLKRQALVEDDVVSETARFEHKVENLPERQRKVTYLYMDGYTQEEIGEELGYSQKTISNVLKKI